MIINDLDDYYNYIVFDTKNRNTEQNTLITILQHLLTINIMLGNQTTYIRMLQAQTDYFLVWEQFGKFLAIYLVVYLNPSRSFC